MNLNSSLPTFIFLLFSQLGFTYFFTIHGVQETDVKQLPNLPVVYFSATKKVGDIDGS
jgi:hypothetical protein